MPLRWRDLVDSESLTPKSSYTIARNVPSVYEQHSLSQSSRAALISAVIFVARAAAEKVVDSAVLHEVLGRGPREPVVLGDDAPVAAALEGVQDAAAFFRGGRRLLYWTSVGLRDE
ncbi:unnamed protein product [Phytophthora fragariaefolia]|uniref:Unnamed protein product n=1 Tax=Phytophthora fragariaefolia TaxID=1490495 RepID=A0A9W6XLH1_9STRA|nr:unnamed protein product [Phytophthora fragariaefolia]